MSEHDPTTPGHGVSLPRGAEDLVLLADQLDGLAFVLSAGDGPALRRERDRVARLLRGVARRAAAPDAPLLVVVGGGSGAGKSTLVNTLAGRRVSPAGVVRPTTRAPVLVCHPDDVAELEPDDRLLPGLVRVDAARVAQVVGERTLLVATSTSVPAGIALLDTPDIDSVEHANRDLADRALDGADVWLWLATARTYADEVGMGYLRRAARRQALLALVLTQVPDAHRDELLEDATRLLEAHALPPARRVTIALTEVVDDQLPRSLATPLSAWLAELAPLERRRAVRAHALGGLVAAVPAELADLAAAVQVEVDHADRLRGLVTARFGEVATELDAELEAGLSLRAEILDSWRQLVGGSAWLSRVQTSATQLGALVRDRLGLRPVDRADRIQAEVATELVRVLDRLLDRAHTRIRRDLEADRAGAALLDHEPGLRAAPAARRGDLERLVADWQVATTALLEEVGEPRKRQAQRATLAINSLATSAILVLFSVSGGLTAGEVGIAAGAAATSQWVLTQVLGRHNVERLLADMHADLQRRVADRVAEERRPLVEAIERLRPSDAVVAALAAPLRGRR
ncbi:MAG: dynamin family protein [Nitriliruptoraceae bacterium]